MEPDREGDRQSFEYPNYTNQVKHNTSWQISVGNVPWISFCYTYSSSDLHFTLARLFLPDIILCMLLEFFPGYMATCYTHMAIRVVPVWRTAFCFGNLPIFRQRLLRSGVRICFWSLSVSSRYKARECGTAYCGWLTTVIISGLSVRIFICAATCFISLVTSGFVVGSRSLAALEMS